jgi:hypothetical protein
MNLRILLLALVFARFSASAQTNPAVILDPNILTVQLYLAGAPLTQPVVELNAAAGSLMLEFDHYGPDIKDYLYTFQHCNSDWKPSDLNDNEYIDGFTEDRITDFSNSFNSLTNYTHYRLGLPNRNMRWSKSGNYLLKVFDNDDDRRLVLVRRFMVVEPLWGVEAQFVRTAQVQYMNTHHEIDFTVLHRSTRVQNPINDVKAFVLQNGRWDNAIGPLSTNFTRAGDQLVFDYQDKIVFPAGKEWRFFDMRSFDYRGERVRRIEEKRDYYEVTLQPDESRANTAYIFRGDLNGRYSIENTNFNQTLSQCDYARVLFSIQRNLPEDDADVYVFGELSDWQLHPEFKMIYDPEAKVYYAEPFLKQGYYNYQYVLVNRESGKMDEDGYEGNWYETGNLYTILVYFRPFGARFERLMAAVSLDSRQRN